MTISYVDEFNSGASASFPITLTVPGTAEEGDLILVQVANQSNDGNTCTSATDWADYDESLEDKVLPVDKPQTIIYAPNAWIGLGRNLQDVHENVSHEVNEGCPWVYTNGLASRRLHMYYFIWDGVTASYDISAQSSQFSNMSARAIIFRSDQGSGRATIRKDIGRVVTRNNYNDDAPPVLRDIEYTYTYLIPYPDSGYRANIPASNQTVGEVSTVDIPSLNAPNDGSMSLIWAIADGSLLLTPSGYTQAVQNSDLTGLAWGFYKAVNAGDTGNITLEKDLLQADFSGMYWHFIIDDAEPTPTIPPFILNNLCGYAETYQSREKWRTLADGAVWVDQSGTAQKRDFRLDFCHVPTDIKNVIDNAFGTVTSDNGTSTYRSPLAENYVITVHPDLPSMDWTATDSLGTMYWSGTMRLREV